MGFFDNKGSEGKTKEETSRLEKEVIDLLLKYQDANKRLIRTGSYEREIGKLKKNIIAESTAFFQRKGFSITQLQGFTHGIKAVAGDTVIELVFEGNTDIAINIPGVWAETLSLSDRKQERNTFQGTVHENQLIMPGMKSENEYERLLEAKRKIEEDLKGVEEKIRRGYVPELQIEANELDTTFPDITQYLEALNEQLK